MRIDAVSGLLAVLAQSGLYSERNNTVMTVTVAILASFSVFIQSLMKQLDYSGRAMLHDSAAIALKKIYQLAKLRAREQTMVDLDDDIAGKSEKKRSDRPDGLMAEEGGANEAGQDDGGGEDAEAGLGPPLPDTHVVNAEDHFTLSKQFEQALEGCTSVVPSRISEAFDALETRIQVCNKRLVPTVHPKPTIAWEKVYPALYHQLTLTIIGSNLWPYRCPSADWAVEKTIRDFQSQDACLLGVLVTRAKEIDRQYHSLPGGFDDKVPAGNVQSSTETTPLLEVSAH